MLSLARERVLRFNKYSFASVFDHRPRFSNCGILPVSMLINFSKSPSMRSRPSAYSSPNCRSGLPASFSSALRSAICKRVSMARPSEGLTTSPFHSVTLIGGLPAIANRRFINHFSDFDQIYRFFNINTLLFIS